MDIGDRVRTSVDWTRLYGNGKRLRGTVRELRDRSSNSARTVRVELDQPHRPGPGTATSFWFHPSDLRVIPPEPRKISMLLCMTSGAILRWTVNAAGRKGWRASVQPAGTYLSWDEAYERYGPFRVYTPGEMV